MATEVLPTPPLPPVTAITLGWAEISLESVIGLSLILTSKPRSQE
jgi:hypothetical protein